MKKKLLDTKFTIKEVVATGIGAALFVVIGMISIPTPVPNTSIQLQYAVQALFSVIFGPFVGFLMGLIGHVIKDAMATVSGGHGLSLVPSLVSFLVCLKIASVQQKVFLK